MIELRAVSYSYPAPGGDVPAVVGMDFALREGELLAVVGHNGSGKSTLAMLAAGLLSPSTGQVLIDGVRVGVGSHESIARASVGVVFQNPDNQIVGTVVEEDAAFGPENLGVPRAELRVRVDEALATVGLTGLERREPHLLSGGQKQRLAIAGALAMRPSYLVLDEPTAMLDPAGRRDVLRVLDTLRDSGHGIMHITHHLVDATIADRVLVMRGGTTAFLGTPAELFAEERLADLGLSLPPIGLLAAELRRRGLDVPTDAMDPGRVAGAIWPS